MKKYFFKTTHEQSIIEEIVNASLHGIGLVFSITALILLIIYATWTGNTTKIISSILFGLTLVLMYASSTLYHSVQKEKVKKALRVFDHASIYLLIAGTYTPLTLICLHDSLGWTLFCVIWSIALLGIIFKLFFTDRFHGLSTALYLAMGWFAVIFAKPIYHAIPPFCFQWIVWGGILYTVGVIFYAWKKLRFSHSVWHVFVMAASFCHFFAVWQYILPQSV